MSAYFSSHKEKRGFCLQYAGGLDSLKAISKGKRRREEENADLRELQITQEPVWSVSMYQFQDNMRRPRFR